MFIYHLGNPTCTIANKAGWCRYFHDHVLDDMARGLGGYGGGWLRKYQPEPGAYGGSSGGHHHHHDHHH